MPTVICILFSPKIMIIFAFGQIGEGILHNAWFPFARKCRERVKVADVIEYFYLCAVDNDSFEHRDYK